jgi:hypothetical protein
MSRILRVHCDGCHRETEPEKARGWYLVSRDHIRRLVPDRLVDPEPDDYDLCSLPCLIAWAQRRELTVVSG